MLKNIKSGKRGGVGNYMQDIALFTDFYELTMSNSYLENGMNEEATFELYVRGYPKNRSYLLVAGLEQTLSYLKNLRFSSDAIRYLKSSGAFTSDFLKYLKRFRFTGDVYAMEEGSVAFESEPIISITAPRIEAQLIETYVMNNIGFQTMIATKASRIVHAARGKPVVDFSPRRTHGIDAAVKVARASYIAGFSATSNVLAGKLFNIPLTGTVAHSYIMSFSDEEEAFRKFAESYPKNSVLLIDTYDTIEGARKAAEAGKELKARGHNLKGVRIDSGNLASLSKKVRKILDSEGFKDARIFASGNLDEYKIEALLKKGARIDAFGVGTELGTSGDAPSLNCAYKIVESANGKKRMPVMKLSSGKHTLPGRKQVYRVFDPRGKMSYDIIALHDERLKERTSPERRCRKLLIKVMEGGKLTYKHPSLLDIQEAAKKNLDALPSKFKKIINPPKYKVVTSRMVNYTVNSINKMRKRK